MSIQLPADASTATPAHLRRGIVRGTVRSTAGEAIAGAVVRVEPLSQRRHSIPVPLAHPPYTGVDGTYQFSLEPATYRIYATADAAGITLHGERGAITVTDRATVTVDLVVAPASPSL